MKRMKPARRLAALLTAAVLTVLLGVTAFAEDPSGTGRYGVYVTDGTTITFRKEIVLKNDGAAYVYSPDITYTYSVAPVAEADLNNATVTDSTGESLSVNGGAADGVTINKGTAAFTSERVALTNGTATISKNLTATIDLTKFNGEAGIYRYVITETVDKDNLTAQGITRGTSYPEQRYLDVYISNNTETADDGTQTNVLKVSGYVIFAADSPAAVINGQTADSETISGKTEGFVDKTEKSVGGEGAASLADTYHTYNLTVKVDILGSLADVENLFPVTISTDAGTALAGRQFDYSVTVNNTTTNYTGKVGPGIIDAGGQVSTDVTANMAKNDSITVYGLPANTRFNVTEENNAGTAYNISVKSGDITLEGKSAVKVDNNDTISAFDAAPPSDDKRPISGYTDYTTTGFTQNYAVLTFTNTLNDVSLTGVALRAAPYAILLAAAAVLGALWLNSRKKKGSKNVL